jgi:hypothetical protein
MYRDHDGGLRTLRCQVADPSQLLPYLPRTSSKGQTQADRRTDPYEN